MNTERASQLVSELEHVPPIVEMPEKVDALRREVASLKARPNETWGKREQLRRGLLAAHDQDNRARAAAIRGGEAAPAKQTKVAAVEKLIQDATQEYDALTVAIEAASVELAEAVTEYAQSSVDEVRARRDATKTEYKDLLAALPAARQQATAHGAWSNWVERLASNDGDRRFRNFTPGVPLQNAGGPFMEFDVIYRALLADLEPLGQRRPAVELPLRVGAAA